MDENKKYRGNREMRKRLSLRNSSGATGLNSSVHVPRELEHHPRPLIRLSKRETTYYIRHEMPDQQNPSLFYVLLFFFYPKFIYFSSFNFFLATAHDIFVFLICENFICFLYLSSSCCGLYYYLYGAIKIRLSGCTCLCWISRLSP